MKYSRITAMQNGGHRRHASPPRPTLMVGDLAQCRAAFERLQRQCADLLQGTAGRITWEDLVPRYRALRESLLSISAPLPFFTQALEASSDTCLRAGSYAEFLKSVQQLVLVSYPALAAELQVSFAEVLKSVQQLVLVSYPALAAEEQVSVQLHSLRLSESGDNNGASPGTPVSAPHDAQACMLQRWPEFAGALLLYFVCIPAVPESMDLAALLRRLPHSLQRCPEVSYALEAHRAMTQQGGLAFLQLHSRGTWVQQALMLPRLQQMQWRAVATFGSAYRTLSAEAALGLLCMRGAGMERLHVLLKSCAEQGMLQAQRAWSAAQMAEGHGRQLLVFHA